ncbi:MAG TPA: outer membrane beta-barrel protein [Bacteroidia bacterium]
MKKIKTLVLGLLFVGTLNAQESAALKPVQGTWTTQVGLSISNSFSNINSMGLNCRYFLKDQLAVRASLLLNNQKNTRNYFENNDGTGNTGTYTTTDRSTGLSLGVEKHFGSNRRLSPYVGFQLGFGGGKTIYEGENANSNSYRPAYSENQENKNNYINANIFLGFDFWITEGLYIGIEYNALNLRSTRYPESERTVSSGGVSAKNVTGKATYNYIDTISGLPMFRFGWML